MNIKTKLEALGHTLPGASEAVASYVPYVISNKQIFIAGQIPMIEGRLYAQGQVGVDITIEQAVKAAEICALNILAQADKAVGGDWSRIEYCIKLGGFVSCAAGFDQQSAVINGASDLIVAVMGDNGKHARFAVGAPALPRNAAVEVEAIFALKD